MKNGNGYTMELPIKNGRGEVVGKKEVATYRGLLAKAHEEGLRRIETTSLQLPDGGNDQTAVVLAKVETGKGTFTGLGDANPKNVSPQVVPHLIRVAETRAKARALRDAVNIGVVCLVELGAEVEGNTLYEEEVEGTIGADGSAPASNGNGNGDSGKVVPIGKPTGDKPTSAASVGAPADRKPEPMSENQRRYLFRLLAGKNILGEAAKTFLLKELGVRALREATKAATSNLIDRLVKEKEAANAHAHG